ncbi:MAG: hypothetical protein H6825_00970 [Planctomycetes bacterium]|nr:hypothetical protein [Planctomycetota bacterium]
MTSCFLISPMGELDSRAHRLAERLFETLVRPAMQACDVDVVRAADMRDPGRITKQLFSAMFSADFCVAVLSGHNPNVMYELAMAQAARKPVISLIERGEKPPFDVHDWRAIPYDLHAPDLDAEVARLSAAVAHLQSTGFAPSDDLLAEYGVGPGGHVRTFERVSEYGSPEAWARLVRAARGTLDLMGVSLEAWRRVPDFEDDVAERAAAGCKVRILVLAPDNPILDLVADRTKLQAAPDQIRSSVRLMLPFFQDLAARHPGIELRTLAHGAPTVRLTRNDDTCLAMLHLRSLNHELGDGPLVTARAGTRLYDTFGREFEAFWSSGRLVGSDGCAEA